MELNDFQKECLKTANYPPIGHKMMYPAIGLANEAGEVLGKVKKLFRDDNGFLTEERRHAIADETADCFWYVCTLAHELGFTLEEIAQKNIVKLRKRVEEGKICGDGDKR